MIGVITVALAVASPPVIAYLMCHLLRGPDRFRGVWLGTAASGVVVGTVRGHWYWAAGSAVSLAVALAAWWWRRKKRRNALAVLGAKARAARDALVRKAREVAQPRPVLRPVPQGAR